MSSMAAYYGEGIVKRKVYLHGYLGELFGKEFELAVRSPVEAIRLLEANFPRKFSEAVKQGTFQVIVAGVKTGVQCTLEMCHFLFPKGSIHIVPVPEGSGGNGAGGGRNKGIILSILGVALIATAFVGAAFLSGAGSLSAGFSTAIFGGVTWGQVGLFGAALLLLGVAMLLTPTPKSEDPVTTYGSFFYSGATNSDREGGPVPIVYGRCFAGSVVVAGGVYNDAFAVTENPVAASYITVGSDGHIWIEEGNDNGSLVDGAQQTYEEGTFSETGQTYKFPSILVRYDHPTPVGGLDHT